MATEYCSDFSLQKVNKATVQEVVDTLEEKVLEHTHRVLGLTAIVDAVVVLDQTEDEREVYVLLEYPQLVVHLLNRGNNILQTVVWESFFFNQGVAWVEMTRLWAILVSRWLLNTYKFYDFSALQIR